MQLTIRDEFGSIATEDLLISLNNTPPKVQIASIQDGATYSLNQATIFSLEASVADAEHPQKDLKYAWQTVLNHNAHSHPEAIDTNRISSTRVVPTGCDGELYSYDILLEVTDAAGLTGTDKVRLYPNCNLNFVDLLAFDAFKDLQTVQLEWSTANERNLDYMEVQRKRPNAATFEVIGNVSANQISQQTTTYDFVDANPHIGNNTYRLVLFSKDGFVDYSIEKTLFFSQKGALIYFPNPSSESITFYWDVASEYLELELYNSNGQLVKKQNWTNFSDVTEVRVDISLLPVGIYYFRLKNEELIEVGSVIKQ